MFTKLNFTQNEIIIKFIKCKSDNIDDYYLKPQFEYNKFYLNEIKSQNQKKESEE